MLEEELHKLLETSADAAFVADRHGTMLFWNRAAAKLFGYPAAHVVGRTCAELLDGRGALGSQVCRPGCTILEWCAAGREIPNFDLEARTNAGRRLWVNVSVLQCPDRHGRRQYSVHLMRDISERKKNEELCDKLLHAARQLVALAAVSLHDDEPVSPLSDQEKKILRSLAKGRSPAETAARLKITPRTLRNHLYNVNRKLGTRSRLAAVVHATQRGLI